MATEKQKKLGLALSGGGFRASYFHIGVLAQMAEQGLLRDVEVISAVSGGSIIAALYYLHVKKLLESKPDEEITDQDYVDLVERIETDFKKATDRNIRLRTFADFRSNLKMAAANYSRSDRISELYNAYFYRDILNSVSDPVQMRELKIHPPGEPADFHPKKGNARRQAKVPILNINATVLNNGQDWQFTAQTMGEPLGDEDVVVPETVTPADIYRRASSYADIAPHQQNFELGHAVGASACVPGLFPPLAVSGLYQDGDDPIRIQLVDGGVYDNQGIEALLWAECTHFIVSDASLQLAVEDEPSTDTLPVLLRASDCVTPDRLRSETFDNLFATFGRDKTAFMHLRKDLGIFKIPWIDQNGMPAASRDPSLKPKTREHFGVAPEVQELLANVRTDLDAFSEVEAYSLMLDGYRMSAPELDAFRNNNGFGAAKAKPAGRWSFLAIAPKIDAQNPSPDLLKQLKVSELRFGKAMMLIPALSVLFTVLMVLLLVTLWPYLKLLLEIEIPLGAIAVLVAVVAAYQHLIKWERMFEFLKPVRLAVDAVKRILLNVLPALLLMPIIWVYLKLINPLYLWRGRVDNLDLNAKERLQHFLRWLKSNPF
jgi:predicted acylesterase/phospholipase RssA